MNRVSDEQLVVVAVVLLLGNAAAAAAATTAAAAFAVDRRHRLRRFAGDALVVARIGRKYRLRDGLRVGLVRLLGGLRSFRSGLGRGPVLDLDRAAVNSFSGLK